MKQIKHLLILSLTLTILSCKSNSKTATEPNKLLETLNEKNRVSVSLLNRIRKLPGISLRNGTPIFNKSNNSVEAYGEPLYILDDYTIGNSFKSANGIVESINIKKVEALSSADASFYGTRAANGVIKITTYQ